MSRDMKRSRETSTIYETQPQIMNVDEVDLRLIEELQKDGRKQYVSLTKKRGVAEGTIRNRLRTTEDCGLVSISALTRSRKAGIRIRRSYGTAGSYSRIRVYCRKIG